MKVENNAFFSFKNLLDEFAEIPEKQINDFVNLTEKKIYLKNEFFSTIENPSALMAFVEKGLFRVYIIDKEGNEATLNFRSENMPMSSYGAIVLNQIEPVYIQALEDSEIYTIKKEDFLNFWETYPKWKDILQEMTEFDCLRLRRREFSFLLDDAKTRYLDFLKDFKSSADRIKLRYIASYLGITPEALSRIRSSPI